MKMNQSNNKLSKKRIDPQKTLSIREKALMLCGAAATGDEITIHRLKILLAAKTPINQNT